jgi:hypothetical protein
VADPALIKLIVKSYAARAMSANPQMSISEVAEAEGHKRDYFGVLLCLNWLAPDIVQAILDGRQPTGPDRESLCPNVGTVVDLGRTALRPGPRPAIINGLMPMIVTVGEEPVVSMIIAAPS